MRFSILIVALALLCPLRAEDAADLEAGGVDALKLSQTKSDAIVMAAAFFAKASSAYETAGDSAKATEMNSFLYWCKKKMTLSQIDTFLREHETAAPALAKRLKEIEGAPAPVEEAQNYFNRAEAFATAHPNENLLIAIRFFEVADRFRGSDAGLKALDRSLKAQQLAMAETASKKSTATNPPALSVPAARVSASADGTKAAAPGAAELKTADATIKDLFKAQYQKNTLAERMALGRDLLKSGRETVGDAVSRFALLREAKTVSAAAGDIAAAIEAVELLEKDFAVDGLQLKTQALATAGGVAAPETRLAVALAYVKLIEGLETADKYDEAAKLFSPAESAARRVGDPPVTNGLLQRVKDARELQAEAGKVKKALETLAATPADPAANLLVGRFYCLAKSDWERGLAMLSSGADAAYKEAAAAEIARPNSAEEIGRCADLWWALAEKEKNKASQMRLQLHAKPIYEKAILTGAQGLILAKLWSHMKLMPPLPGAEPPAAGANLLDRAFADKLLVITGTIHGAKTWDGFSGSSEFLATTKGKKPVTVTEGNITYGVEVWGKKRVLDFHPVNGKIPTTVDFSPITQNTQGVITIYFHNCPGGDSECDIEKEGKVEKTVKVGGDVWKSEKIVFQRQPVKIVNRATGWFRENAYITYDVELH